MDVRKPVTFSLRNYRDEDFDTLLAIDQSCFTPEIAYSAFELKTYIKRKTSFTLVAETPEAQNAEGAAQPGTAKAIPILGFIVAEHSRGLGHIITIDVRAQARRHRVGSRLLDAAERRLRELKCDHARLETAVDNISALSFYKRHGYHVIKTIPRYYSNGVDALLLEKDLLSPPPSR
jgi:ribosomal-protein-alanine N-acetyltransferase